MFVCTADTVGADWLVSLMLPAGTDRARVMEELQAQGIESRLVFYPARHMPMSVQALHLPVATLRASVSTSRLSFFECAVRPAAWRKAVPACRTGGQGSHAPAVMAGSPANRPAWPGA